MKLGRYEIVRELGKGAMGIVYLAKDPVIGRLVALKTIRINQNSDDDETREFQQRFLREAQAAGILNHPNIVTVHDIGQDDGTGTSFIAMEFVEGNNLKEVLSQGRALSFEQIGDLICQVAEALDFAHAKGIVHRDVKPANIILLEGNRAKITDFGIAKIADGVANLTSTGQFLGTPNYMAPEQVKGAPVDGRTDIFALGICLYECLTRRKPFGGDSLTSISYKIVHEPFPPLVEINPQIPEGYEDVIANCLAKDPVKRYQRARDMATALRSVIRGERPARPAEPMLAEETVITIDRKRGDDGHAATPTLEVPFPDAVEAPAESNLGGSTRPGSKAAVASSTAAAKAKPVAARAASVPLALQLRKTLTNVRALPLWKHPISPYLFIGIVVVLVALLIGAIAAVRSQQEPVPTVDRVAEARRAQEKRLREEGTALLQQGRVAEARAKFEQLQKLAPQSPFVITTMSRLNAIRQREEIGKQQIQLAEQKFQEGMVLFTDKKYPEAITLFQESFSLNPNSDQTVQYLKIAQDEQQKAEQAKTASARRTTTESQVARTLPRRTETTGTTATAATTQTASAAPAQLTTVFTHPFTDGRIIVRIGADVVANENLYEDRPARLFRRASRAPRPISVTHSLTPKNADMQVWVTVPAEKINEHHAMQAVRFESGQQRRLVVRYDPASKKFTYELN